MRSPTMTDTAGEARLNLDALRERLDDKIARTAPGRERRFFEDLRDALLSSAEAREEGSSRSCVEVQGTTALHAETLALVEALERIRDLEPAPFAFPEDWTAQIAACEECQRYRDHPIQRGICDTHRRPLWDREAHDDRQPRLLYWEAKGIAREALSELAARKAAVPSASLQLRDDPLQAAETRAQEAEARVERAIQAADAILARVTMVAGRYLYDAPSVDLVPVLAEEKVELTAQMFRDLYNATSRDGSEIR